MQDKPLNLNRIRIAQVATGVSPQIILSRLTGITVYCSGFAGPC